MINTHLSDDEQGEILKKWLRENGKSLVGGTMLGLAVVFGWQSWSQHRLDISAQAAAEFDQLSGAVSGKRIEEANNLTTKLRTEHPSSIYTTLAALSLAKAKADQGDLAGARSELEKVITDSDEPSLQQVARLRLARVQLAQSDIDGAAAVVEGAPEDDFAGEFAQLRGDIARARHQPGEARTAYQEAIDKGVGNSPLVQMKLEDLGLPAAKEGGA